MTLALETMGGPVGELERAEQRRGKPGMGGERQEWPVNVWRELPAGPDEPHRVFAELALRHRAG